MTILAKAFEPSILNDSYPATIDTLDEQNNPFNTKLPIGDVSLIQGSESNILQDDGTYTNNMVVTWTALSENFAYLDHHIIEIKENGGTYRPIGVCSSESTTYTIENVLGGGTDYYIRIKTVSIFSIVSDGK